MTKTLSLVFIGICLVTALPAQAQNILAVQHGKTLKLTFDDFAVHATITSVQVGQTAITPGFIGVHPDDPGTTVNGVAAGALFIGVDSVIVKAGDSLNEVHFVKVGIAKNLSFTGGKGSGDSVSFGDCEIGGNASFKAGPNGISLEGAFSSVGGNFQVNGGPGDDSVAVTVDVNHLMKVSLGDGENHSMLSGSVGGSVSLKTGKGADANTLFGISAAKSVSVDSGDGENTTFILSVVAPKVSYKSASGNDTLTFDGCTVEGDASFSLGNGNNEAVFENSALGKNLNVKAGAGDDSVTLDGATPAGQFKPNLGKGTNTITL
jgi:hypothetical protein